MTPPALTFQPLQTERPSCEKEWPSSERSCINIVGLHYTSNQASLDLFLVVRPQRHRPRLRPVSHVLTASGIHPPPIPPHPLHPPSDHDPGPSPRIPQSHISPFRKISIPQHRAAAAMLRASGLGASLLVEVLAAPVHGEHGSRV